jgi:hypothetical protein
MIMKKITILEITMMPSLKNPEVDVEALKGGILLVVGAAASANSEGQVPKRLPKRFRHIVFVDPVKDPKAADMAEKDPRVLAMEEEAEVVAPNLMREGVPLVVISYAGQVPESTRKEWSTLLGVSEEDLACYQRRRKVALFGMGCGASPIENWESFFQALTKEYLEVIDKVMVLLPLANGHAGSFYSLTKGSDPAYPAWASEDQKEEVAKLLGKQCLPEPADFPRLFNDKVRALLGKEPSEKPDEDLRKAKTEGIARVRGILQGIV